MDAITMVYLILGVILFLAFGFILLFIAGKDIFYAFMRKLIPKGMDIFLLNYNRQVEHLYKVPDKEGIIKIKGKPYIVNPNKVLSLGLDFRNQVEKSMAKKQKRMNARIKAIEEKMLKIKEEVSQAEEAGVNDMLINQMIENFQLLKSKRDILVEQLQENSNLYYYRRRPMVLYIENDPVPKDMFEFYTEMDSTMIDNVIARTMTKDPKSTKDLEKFLKLAKVLLIVGAAAAAFAAIIGFYNQNAITQIADHIGMTIKI